MKPNTVILLNFPLEKNQSYKNKGSVYPSISVLLIGSLLKKNWYDVKIIDGLYCENYLELLINYIKEHEQDILYVGMSVMTTQVPFALNTSKKIKEKFDIPIVWGGPHPTLFPEQTISNKNVDIISINEGAITAVKIANAIQNKVKLGSVKGIVYKSKKYIHWTPDASLENIEKLPHFDFSIININDYLEIKSSVYDREFPDFKGKVKVAPILTGLGCPYKCQFCINVILKRRYRFRKADSIVKEIKRLQKEYSINTFVFMDEDFFVNKKRVLEFVELVEKENLKFNYRFWCRVDHFKDNFINEKLIKRLEKIGYGSFVMGGESGNQEILNSIKKGITTEQILNSLRMLKGTKITPRYSFIVGFENETLKQIKNTYNFCFKMKKIEPRVDIAGPFIFRLYPGSPIFNRLVKKYNLQIPEDLNSWEEFIVKNQEEFIKMPWTPIQFQNSLKYIEFYGSWATRRTILSFNFKKFCKYILSKTAMFRMKIFCFIFPIEYWLYQLQKKWNLF